MEQDKSKWAVTAVEVYGKIYPIDKDEGGSFFYVDDDGVKREAILFPRPSVVDASRQDG